MDQIPLNIALICVNCNTICRMPQRACPHCAGEQLMPLSAWLSPRPTRATGGFVTDPSVGLLKRHSETEVAI